jgi:hypothetical protein
MNEIDKAYAAGFLDGEGSIYISKGRKLKSGDQLFLCVSVNNTDFAIVRLFKDWFNGQTSISPDTRTKRKLMRLRVYSNQATKLLETLLPYLRVKSEQARLALEFQGKMTNRSLTNEERLFYKTKISSYNQKGRTIA